MGQNPDASETVLKSLLSLWIFVKHVKQVCDGSLRSGCELRSVSILVHIILIAVTISRAYMSWTPKTKQSQIQQKVDHSFVQMLLLLRLLSCIFTFTQLKSDPDLQKGTRGMKDLFKFY